MICNLGRSDEEKFVNIQKIKNTKKRYLRFIKIVYIIGYLILCSAVYKGTISATGMGKVGSIIELTLLVFLAYLYMGHFVGTGIAWGLYLFDSGELSTPETMDEKELNEKIVHAYIVGGHERAAAVESAYLSAEFFMLAIMFCIGYWLGILNYIVHFFECRAVTKRMKEKYKKSKED